MPTALRHAILALAFVGTPIGLAAQSSTPTIVVDPGHPSEVSSDASMHNGTSEVHIAWQVAHASLDYCARTATPS
jgi:N-acetylmuramoyl-L-alanine amidase